MFLKKFLCIILTLNVISFSGVGAYAQDNQAAQSGKGSLVVVGDANLTYASYFFTLPSGWMPALNQQLMQYTHEIGYWRGMRVDDEIAIVIVPDKKERGKTVEDFIRFAKERNVKEEGCSLNSMIEHAEFNIVLKYPYKIYKWNCPKGTYGLSVFLDLPTHVIFFNLSGRGRDENCLLPYFDDFRKMLTSFRWLLGLSDEEIGKLFKDNQ